MFDLFPILTQLQLEDTLKDDNIVVACNQFGHSVVPHITMFIKLDKEKNKVIVVSYENNKDYVKEWFDRLGLLGSIFDDMKTEEYDFDRMYEIFHLLSEFKLYGVYYNRYN